MEIKKILGTRIDKSSTSGWVPLDTDTYSYTYNSHTVFIASRASPTEWNMYMYADDGNGWTTWDALAAELGIYVADDQYVDIESF